MANLPVLSQALPVAQTTSVIPQNYANPGFSLSQIFSILRAYRRKILMISASLAVVISFAVMSLPRSYEAVASLLVNYEVNDPLAGKEFPIGLLGSYMATQIELMQSPVVLLPVIERLGLANNHKFTKGYRGDPAGLPAWLEKNFATGLSIDLGHGSQLIYISYTDGDPDEAARFANAVADVYTDQHVQRLSGPADDRAQRYTAQLDELKKKVDAAQDQLTAFRQRTGLIDTQTKSDADMAQLTALQQRLLEVQNERRLAETRTDANQAFQPQAMGSTVIQTLKTQEADQEAKLAQLQSTLGPRHPEIIELKSQLAATRAAMDAELKNYSGGAASDLKTSSELEKKLQAAVADERQRVLKGRMLEDEAAKYQLELESAQSVYKRALDGYDQVAFASTDHYSNVSIASRALRPLKATKPKTLKLLMMGVMGSFGATLVGVLFYELFNRRVRCRDDLEREYGVPVLVEFGSANALGVRS